jgi:hypothetical protein
LKKTLGIERETERRRSVASSLTEKSSAVCIEGGRVDEKHSAEELEDRARGKLWNGGK